MKKLKTKIKQSEKRKSVKAKEVGKEHKQNYDNKMYTGKYTTKTF